MGTYKEKTVLKTLSLLCILFVSTIVVQAKSYLLHNDPSCRLWWAGSTCKIMRNDPAPAKKGDIIIRAAKNESESFQLIFTPETNLENISIAVSDFKNKEGKILSSANATVRNVEYVYIAKPSGLQHQPGLYPDPLPLCSKPFSAAAGMNTPVLITFRIPEETASGSYAGNISIKSSQLETTVPVKIEIWDFTLPRSPSIRSAFGLYSGMIKEYHNLETEEELRQATDLYFQAFRDYRISPQQFHDLYPIGKTVKGIEWEGGTFDPDTVFEGRYSYQVTDSRINRNAAGAPSELISVSPEKPYLLKWQAKTLKENQKYYVTVKSYTSGREPINWHLQGMFYTGSTHWRKDSLFLDPKNPVVFDDMILSRPMPKEAKYIKIQLYPVLPDEGGEEKGTVWFDDFQVIDAETGQNLLPQGNFEPDINKLDVVLDFSAFDKAARKYLDEFGFTGFRVKIPELRPGPYWGRKTGWFEGFINGTDEYKKLIGLYLKGLQDHLEANGWLGKEYLYWVDEPKHGDYNFVREGMITIHEAAPKLTRLITENNPGPEIMDVTEIGCPVLAKFNPEKSKEWLEKGRQMWSYLMTWPKAPHLNLFIDSDAINLRMWLWMSYYYHLSGILVWNSNMWNNDGCSPKGVLQNIWEDPMTYMDGNGLPAGAAAEYGNGDGMFFYPPNRNPNADKSKYLCGPVPSLRLEILRQGIDDFDYLVLLDNFVKNARPGQENLVKKANLLLNLGPELFTNEHEYIKDPDILEKYRQQAGTLLEQFNRWNRQKQ